ncbi:MAG: phosphoribosyltransferase [Bacillales bacterium]|jgi:competence protein ComFC|nr:phosphoribosyltransferase [Bacillales bacterium]
MSFLKNLENLFETKVDKCLVCNNQIESTFGWFDIFCERPIRKLCLKCEKKFSKIFGDICRTCGRELRHLSIEYYQDGKCMDCIRWEKNNQQFLDRNTAIFNYNDFMKEIISRIKYRGDYKLMGIFNDLIVEKIDFFKKEEFIAIPIPLSEERHIERGFNQAEAFGKACGFHMIHALSRIHSEKQSKKSRSERLKTDQVFRLESLNLAGKKILLIDDIYTTGTTLQHASRILKVQGGAREVHSLTIARS